MSTLRGQEEGTGLAGLDVRIPCLRSDVGIVASRIIPGRQFLKVLCLLLAKGVICFIFVLAAENDSISVVHVMCDRLDNLSEQARHIKIHNPAMRSLIKVSTPIDRLKIFPCRFCFSLWT